MDDPYNLRRFLDAQDGVFESALVEIRAGSKRSHWMWFVFPQIAGLGRSPTARYYAIGSLDEARAYLAHLVLGARLRESVDSLLLWAGRRNPEQIFGPLDALKLRSSLTLFDHVEPGGRFAHALDSFFDIRDDRTLALLNARQ